MILTYTEMNDKIKDILRIGGTPSGLYAAQRIEELERYIEKQKKETEYWERAAAQFRSAFFNLSNDDKG